MHSNDPGKFTSGSDVAKLFWAQFEASLPNDETANFNCVIFPSLSMENRTIKAECLFKSATFRGSIWIDDIIFKRLVSFEGAEVAGDLTVRGNTVFESQEGPSSLPFDSIFRLYSAGIETGLSLDRISIGGDLTLDGQVIGYSTFRKMDISGETRFDPANFPHGLNLSESKFRGLLQVWGINDERGHSV